MRDRPFLVFMLLVCGLAFVVDALTKNWAVQHLSSLSQPIGWEFFGVMHVPNAAFAFSIGTGVLTAWVPLILRVIVLLLLIRIFQDAARTNVRTALGLGFILAGGLGNSVDLLWRGGAVVDFLLIGQLGAWVPEEPPGLVLAFNFADLWLFAGIILLYPAIRLYAAQSQTRLSHFLRSLKPLAP